MTPWENFEVNRLACGIIYVNERKSFLVVFVSKEGFLVVLVSKEGFLVVLVSKEGFFLHFSSINWYNSVQD